MTAIEAVVTRHPVRTYFALAFAVSKFDALTPFVVSAMLAGPSVSGILLTGLVSGKAGLRELLSRLLRWRVGLLWYAAASPPHRS